MKLKFSAVLLCLFLLPGCATVMQAPVGVDATPDMSKGYVYANVSYQSTFTGDGVGLMINSTDDSRQYVIPIIKSGDSKTRIFAAPLEPGNYYLRGLKALQRDVSEAQVHFPKDAIPLSQTFTIKPGHSYYLGEYRVVIYESGMYRRIRLNKFYSNFQKTSVDFHNDYPYFGAVKDELLPHIDKCVVNDSKMQCQMPKK